jgi:ABC-type microcin C transport system duplicated ATPase subunit YejF
VDGVSFSIDAGETFGLVGSRAAARPRPGVHPPADRAHLRRDRFKGENVLASIGARLRQARREMQIVFQDPYSSLNPRMRAGAIVEEPLVIHASDHARSAGARR